MKLATSLLLSLLVLGFVGCQAASAPKSFGFVRAYLVKGQTEDPHYGRYSYLLFPGPGPQWDAKYLAAIEAWMGQMAQADPTLPDTDKAGFNITYLPVTRDLGRDASAQDVLDAYDFIRAGQLLRALSGSSTTGLYLVSVARPLSEVAGPSQHYYSDLSHVPPGVVGHWVELFMQETARADAWTHEEGVVELMRKGVALLAADIENVKTAVLGWIKFGS
jgi:hypothetical protein